MIDTDAPIFALRLRRAIAGDAEAFDWIVRELEPLVKAIARQYSIRGADLDERMVTARLGIVRGIPSFDPDKGSLSSWVWKWMRSELNDLKRIYEGEDAILDEEIEQRPSGPVEISFDSDEAREKAQRAWPYLTDAEKRGLLTRVSGSQLTTVGAAAQISKQAVERGLKSAVKVINRLDSEGPGWLPARRRKLASAPDSFAHHAADIFALH